MTRLPDSSEKNRTDNTEPPYPARRNGPLSIIAGILLLLLTILLGWLAVR